MVVELNEKKVCNIQYKNIFIENVIPDDTIEKYTSLNNKTKISFCKNFYLNKKQNDIKHICKSCNFEIRSNFIKNLSEVNNALFYECYIGTIKNIYNCKFERTNFYLNNNHNEIIFIKCNFNECEFSSVENKKIYFIDCNIDNYTLEILKKQNKTKYFINKKNENIKLMEKLLDRIVIRPLPSYEIRDGEKIKNSLYINNKDLLKYNKDLLLKENNNDTIKLCIINNRTNKSKIYFMTETLYIVYLRKEILIDNNKYLLNSRKQIFESVKEKKIRFIHNVGYENMNYNKVFDAKRILPKVEDCKTNKNDKLINNTNDLLFGFELEVGSSCSILKEILNYVKKVCSNEYHFAYDGSIQSSYSSEIVAIRPQTMKESMISYQKLLYYFSDVLKEMSKNSYYNCGGHIHMSFNFNIGEEKRNFLKENYFSLFKIMENEEYKKEIYKILNRGPTYNSWNESEKTCYTENENIFLNPLLNTFRARIINLTEKTIEFRGFSVPKNIEDLERKYKFMTMISIYLRWQWKGLKEIDKDDWLLKQLKRINSNY